MSGRYHKKIIEDLTRLFDGPLIENSLRGQYVELLVAEIVGTPWFIAGMDWGGHDLEHPDGTRVEIKQSAARQTWTDAEATTTVQPRFSIRPAKGFYRGSHWTKEAGRRAHIYAFAWHSVASSEADHTDEAQWEFYVVPAIELPSQDSIGLAKLRDLGGACSADDLPGRLEQERLISGAGASELHIDGDRR